MKITIISVGKLKEKYLKQGIQEYLKRLSAYAKVDIIEVADEKAPENLSEADMEMVKRKEGERILAHIIPRHLYHHPGNQRRHAHLRTTRPKNGRTCHLRKK